MRRPDRFYKIFSSKHTLNRSILDRHVPKYEVRAYHDANQIIAHNTWIVLALNSERWDTADQHDLAVNNSRLTCKSAGKYFVFGNVQFAANAVGSRGLQIIKNAVGGIGTAYALEFIGTNPASTTSICIMTVMDLEVGDYVELQAYQDSGGNLNVQVNTADSPEFGMVKYMA